MGNLDSHVWFDSNLDHTKGDNIFAHLTIAGCKHFCGPHGVYY